jgi:hypothetical protein
MEDYANGTNSAEFGAKIFGVKKTSSYKKGLGQINSLYPALNTAPNDLFHGKYFMTCLYYFALEHNFIPKYNPDAEDTEDKKSRKPLNHELRRTHPAISRQ